MKVAIMGAGLSGLSCAITLERHGIKPYIFESRSRIGDRFVNGEALFNILNRPINNCLKYFADKYNIYLEPTNEFRKLTIYSKNEAGSIEGRLGFFNIRGRHEKSFENQLVRQVKSEITYNSQYTYEELKKQFDIVVLATGDAAYAAGLGNYRIDVTLALKGAVVEGDFNPYHALTWFDYEFAPKGYSYLMPFSAKEANIVTAYPDSAVNRQNTDELWARLYKRVCNETGQSLRITDRFEIMEYIAGICGSPKINGTYFTGNCFGTLGPAFGFGQFTAILSGIYAGLDICGTGNCEELTKPLSGSYNRSLVIRKVLEELSAEQFDRLVKSLDNRLFDGIIDKMFGDGTRIDVLKWLSRLLVMYYGKRD